jgi:hypothetical protein
MEHARGAPRRMRLLRMCAAHSARGGREHVTVPYSKLAWNHSSQLMTRSRLLYHQDNTWICSDRGLCCLFFCSCTYSCKAHPPMITFSSAWTRDECRIHLSSVAMIEIGVLGCIRLARSNAYQLISCTQMHTREPQLYSQNEG